MPRFGAKTLVCVLFRASNAVADRGTAHLWSRDAFRKFTRQFNKNYSPGEYHHREKVFFRNLHFIVTADVEHSVGLNEFADLTNEEFRSKFHGHQHDPHTMNADFSANFPISEKKENGRRDDRNRERRKILRGWEKKEKERYTKVQNLIKMHTNPPKDVVLRDSKNWADENVVAPVGHQSVLGRSCGSCYSFAGVTALESALAIQTRRAPNILSKQQIIDCGGQFGCMGGNAVGVWDYVKGSGLCSQNAYPYEAAQLRCRSSHCWPAFDPGWILGFNTVSPRERALMHAVLQQPVSVAVHAGEDFRVYKSGVIAEECGKQLNHAVLLIGYGSVKRMMVLQKKYWWIQNSWGTSWGLQGYAKVERRIKGRDGGFCGIAHAAVYPVLS